MATVEPRIGTDITDRPLIQDSLKAAGITRTKGVFAKLTNGRKQLVDIRILLINNRNWVAVGTIPSSGAMGSPNPDNYKLAEGGLADFAKNLKKAEGTTWTNESPQGGRRRRTRRKSRARKSRRSRK
jgi:hypothetical protein